MNRELLIKKAVREKYNDYVGSAINTTWDYEKDTEEYKNAVSFLNDTSDIIDTIYKSIVHKPTTVMFNHYAISIKEDIRFVGTERIKALITEHVNLRIPDDRLDICVK